MIVVGVERLPRGIEGPAPRGIAQVAMRCEHDHVAPAILHLLQRAPDCGLQSIDVRAGDETAIRDVHAELDLLQGARLEIVFQPRNLAQDDDRLAHPAQLLNGLLDILRESGQIRGDRRGFVLGTPPSGQQDRLDFRARA